MRKLHRLNRPKDFKLLFRSGRRIDSPLFRIISRKNDLDYGRFAFVAPRSIEKRSSVRNSLKRRSREWLRKEPDLLREPLDNAIIFKKEACSATRKEFYEELEKKFKMFSSH